MPTPRIYFPKGFNLGIKPETLLTLIVAVPFAAATIYAFVQKKSTLRATLIERVRLVGILEGVSSLLLIIAMIVKYGAGMPAGVKVTGAIHGGMFVVYLLTVLASFLPLKWSFGRLVTMLAAGFIPMATFLLEPSLRKEEATA